jgi:hypothetical protein
MKKISGIAGRKRFREAFPIFLAAVGSNNKGHARTACMAFEYSQQAYLIVNVEFIE